MKKNKITIWDIIGAIVLLQFSWATISLGVAMIKLLILRID